MSYQSFPPRERELYNMAELAFKSCEFKWWKYSPLTEVGDNLILRQIEGDLEAYEEAIEIYGAFKGACNNL